MIAVMSSVPPPETLMMSVKSGLNFGSPVARRSTVQSSPDQCACQRVVPSSRWSCQFSTDEFRVRPQISNTARPFAANGAGCVNARKTETIAAIMTPPFSAKKLAVC